MTERVECPSSGILYRQPKDSKSRYGQCPTCKRWVMLEGCSTTKLIRHYAVVRYEPDHADRR